MSNIIEKIIFGLGFVNLAATSKETVHDDKKKYCYCECSTERKSSSICKSACYIGFFSEFYFDCMNWEIVIEPKLAKVIL